MSRTGRRLTPARLRHSLLARLLAGSVLVALCSITATAWLAAQSTSGAIRREQGQTLASDAHINDTLLGFAATHPQWTGVAQTVGDLARETGRRIALTNDRREPIVDSASPGTPLPVLAAATVDPLFVDVTQVSGAAADRIDRRAVGVFGLSAAELARQRKAAEAYAACLKRNGNDVRMTYGLSGRPSIQITSDDVNPQGEPQIKPQPVWPKSRAEICGLPPVRVTSAETRALERLNKLVNACLTRRDVVNVLVSLDGSWQQTTPSRSSNREAVTECLAAGRRTQLKRHVAPAALLFIGNQGDQTTPGVELTAAGVTRIAAAAAIVLVLAIGVSVVIATRLVRPVHALTDAAQRMRGGDGSARVAVRGEGEVGRLAAAFNEMSEHLERMETQRKAMVSDISHELRTPLSNVRGWLEAAHDGVAELDPALISSLVEEILLLQHIVDDLQELALADAGKLRLHPEPVYLAELLDQIAKAHRNRAETAALRLTTQIHGDPEVYADPVRLRQAIGNLVTNALRFTPAGGQVTLRAHTAGDGHVVIEVADTGVGIDPEELPHVFDRFWRAEKSRNRQTGGSGLGLAIVRSLVEALGGTVSVASTPGAGTSFALRLPAQQPT